jgi:hypothetical protein
VRMGSGRWGEWRCSMRAPNFMGSKPEPAYD